MSNTILYSNSCSFGMKSDLWKTYSEFVSQELGFDLINNGKGGSCNRAIIRKTLRDITKFKTTNQNIIVLIGLTMISRTEKWQPWIEQHNSNDGDFHPILINHKKFDWRSGLNSLHPDVWKTADQKIKNFYKEWLLLYNPEEELTNLCADLVMLTEFLKSSKIKYVIFNSIEPFPVLGEVPFLEDFTNVLMIDQNIIDLWNFSFGSYAQSQGHTPVDKDVYGIHGHPSSDGHKSFAKFLISKYF